MDRNAVYAGIEASPVAAIGSGVRMWYDGERTCSSSTASRKPLTVDDAPVTSNNGPQQGCTHGSNGYNMGYQPILEATAALFPDVFILASTDAPSTDDT